MCSEYGRRLMLVSSLLVSSVTSTALAEDDWPLRLAPIAPVDPPAGSVMTLDPADPQTSPSSPSNLRKVDPQNSAIEDQSKPGHPARSHDGLSPIRFAKLLFLVKDIADR